MYKAQDLEHGKLVAWNEVNIKMYGARERKRSEFVCAHAATCSLCHLRAFAVLNEITLLKQLRHANLIAFYGAWVNKEAEKVVFITELMSSGTLKECVSCSLAGPYPCRMYSRHPPVSLPATASAPATPSPASRSRSTATRS